MREREHHPVIHFGGICGKRQRRKAPLFTPGVARMVEGYVEQNAIYHQCDQSKDGKGDKGDAHAGKMTADKWNRKLSCWDTIRHGTPHIFFLDTRCFSTGGNMT